MVRTYLTTAFAILALSGLFTSGVVDGAMTLAYAQKSTTAKKATPTKSNAKAAKPTTKKTKKAKARTSPCQGLSSSACKSKEAMCSWISATRLKSGKTRKAHCRKKPAKKKGS